MAITIISSPYTHTPGYNEQWFVASGTNTAQTNFKYTVNVVIDGDTVTEKYPARPDNSFLYFNPQRIVESYLRNDYQFNIDEPSKAIDSIKKVTVSVAEEYGSPVSGFTAVSGDYYVWNAAYQSHDFSSYVYSQGSVVKDLTLIPSITATLSHSDTINFNTKYLLKSWHTQFISHVGADKCYQLLVNAYDSNSILIQSTLIYNQYYLSNPEGYIVNVNCSPYGLNLIETNNPGLILSKYDPILQVIPPTTMLYRYKWFDATPLVTSNESEVWINDYCSNYDLYVVHFLNRLGNYDTFTFNLVSVKESKKESKEYRNSPYYLNTSNKIVYDNSKGDRQNYSTIITNKITLNSDWVSDSVYQWLKDLFMSPSIKLEDANGNLFAVTCTNKDYKEKRVINEKIINATIELEFDYRDIRQRG